MPKKQYENSAARAKAWRQRQRLAKASKPPDRPPISHDAQAVVTWAVSRLRIPPGHPRAGAPFRLPEWQISIVNDVLNNRETMLCCGRKNGKSALLAVFVLAHLCGPLRQNGWRCGVLSANRQKAGELLRQAEEIAEASELQGLKVRRTPWPGRLIAEDTGSEVSIEGAGYATGHSAGFDVAIVDELGLLMERNRAAINGMRSSISARNGKFVSLTIHGPGPFVPEILAREGMPGLAIHHYRGDENLALDDPANWRKANPGLHDIKSIDYMRDEAARVLRTTADQSTFAAFDLNLPASPGAEIIVSLDAWRRCESDDLPPRDGPVFVGVDLGGTKSFTSAACYWRSGRLEILTACPGTPGLVIRGRDDAVGTVYERAYRDGMLMVLSGRLTPVRPFLEHLQAHLAGQRIAVIGCDRFRHGELLQHLSDLGLPWRPVWRGSGARATEDAARDIRGFKVAVESGTVKTKPNILMVHAIGESFVVRDASGHAIALRQARQRARIDALQASVIAVGLGAAASRRTRPARVYVA